MTAADQLIAFLQRKGVKIDDLTAQEWIDKLPDISSRAPQDRLSGIRYMVYQTFVREKKAYKDRGERYKGRTDYENDIVVRHLCEYIGTAYARPRDSVKEAAFEAVHSDPCSQAKWFEESDIMN